MKLKMRQWTHPDWDMKLITPANWNARIIATDYLADQDPALLIFEEIEMTEEEIDALPEWDG